MRETSILKRRKPKESLRKKHQTDVKETKRALGKLRKLHKKVVKAVENTGLYLYPVKLKHVCPEIVELREYCSYLEDQGMQMLVVETQDKDNKKRSIGELLNGGSINFMVTMREERK